MVPEGWKLQTVGSIFEVQLGKMLNKAAKEKGSQLPYLTNFNVRWGSFDTTTLNTMYFSERDQEKFALKNGDLILCEGGEVGRCAIWRNEVTPCYYQKALHRLRSKGAIIPEYFQAYMASIAGTKLLEDYTSRTSIAHLTREKLVELPVKVPPLPEQKKIAEILSTWDKAITATERLLENSQQRKKGLMQQLLTGKKRLPGFEGEWGYQEIGRFLVESRIQSDSNDPSKRLTVRLNLKGIEQRQVRGTEAKGSTAHYVRFAGQFIYGKQNIHKAAFGLIPEKFDRCETSQDLPAFDFKQGVDSHWFLYFCSQDWFYTDLEKKMTGTGSKRLNPKAFLKVKLPTPFVDEQRAIAEVLDLASHEINSIKNKLELLQNEKKALMQQLLTGKRRVNVEAEAA